MEEAELLADTVAIISKGKIIATGSPAELIENNTNYLVLTLQSVDANAVEIIRKMGFEPVHDNHQDLKVRVEHTEDILKTLNAIKDAGGRPQPGRAPAQPRRGLPEAHRRGAPRRPGRGRGGGMKLRVVNANLVVKLKTFYRERTAMFFTIAFPIILILVFGTIFLEPGKLSLDLYVQDLDHTHASAQFIKALQINGNFKIIEVDPASDAREYAKNHG